MAKTKRLIGLLLVLALAFTLVLAACGEDEDDTAADEQATAQVEETQAAETAEAEAAETAAAETAEAEEPTPTEEPTATEEPTEEPTVTPTEEPTEEPTPEPTEAPTATEEPTEEPTVMPTATEKPTAEPTEEPTEEPTAVPTEEADEDAVAMQAETDFGVVTIGMNAEYPPFEFVDEDGVITGFDPALVALIAERAGFEYELVNTRWDGIFVALASGEFDMVASAATITDEREEIVDFSNPYFYANQRIAVLEERAEEIQGVDDLAGLRIGVQSGTTGDIYASEEIPGVEVVRYDEITLAFQALANGNVDAIVNDGPTSADIIANNPELNAVLVGEPLSEEYYGIAVQPDLPELLDAVNAALEELIADGTYRELYLEWFGVEPPELFQPEVVVDEEAEAEAEDVEDEEAEAVTEEEEAEEAEEAEAEAEEPVAMQAETDFGVVTIGMNAEYPPFEFVDEDGVITGFDPALVALIAERAGFEYELVNTRWDGIFVALASGEFDMVASAATITDEREEIVDFSNPYFYANQRIAVLEERAEEIQGVDDLAGLRIGVQSGTTGDIYASEEIPGVEVVRYDEITLAFQALANGNVDAIVNDGPTSADIIANNPELNAVLVGEPLSEEYYGIAVQPDLPELLDAVNAALEELIADGTYRELYLEWFGVEPPELFQPEVVVDEEAEAEAEDVEDEEAEEPVAMQAETDFGVVTIGMNAEYPPFEFVDEDGVITGFDPALVALIAERAGFEYELVNTRWDGIFVALASGEFDMVASAATITDEREEIVDFSNPYFYANQRIAVLEERAEEIQGVDDLAGLRIGVQSGTTGDIYASEEIPGVEVVRYDEITLAFQALANGNVDAIVNDGPTSADIIANNPELNAVLVGEPLSEEYYGIAVQPDLPELLDAVNAALEELIADGTYRELYLEWFDVEPPELFQPEVAVDEEAESESD